jgi:hypothetical protein
MISESKKTASTKVWLWLFPYIKYILRPVHTMSLWSHHDFRGRVRIMVLSDTFNNIAVISWRSVLLVVETGVPGENHRSAGSHWQTLSQNVVHLTLIVIRTHNISGDMHWLLNHHQASKQTIKKSLKIPKVYSESVNRDRTDNTMTKRKRTGDTSEASIVYPSGAPEFIPGF